MKKVFKIFKIVFLLILAINNIGIRMIAIISWLNIPPGRKIRTIDKQKKINLKEAFNLVKGLLAILLDNILLTPLNF